MSGVPLLSGVLRTASLMFTALPLQRVLLLVGSLSAVVGLGALAAGVHHGAIVWLPAVLAGSSILGLSIAPVFGGGIALRDLSASRAVQLIPHARLQLLIGCLLAELLAASLVALFFAITANREHLAATGFAPSILFGAVFVGLFAAATVAFVTLYYASRSQLGFLAPLAVVAVVPLAARAFPQLTFHGFFTSAMDLLMAFGGALGVWTAFGALYLNARRIAPPVWGRIAITSLGGTTAPPRWLAGKANDPAAQLCARRDAMHVLLTGSYPGLWGGIARPVLAVTAGGLACYALVATSAPHHALTGFGKLLAVMIAYSGGIMSAIGTFPMIGRARYLWLKTGLDRRQLFRAAEAQSWRALATLGLPAATAVALICLLAKVPLLVIGELLILSAVSGALMIYVVLMRTRGWRLADIVLATVLSATWFLELVVASAFELPGSLFLFLLAAQAVLIPVLRAWSRARWTRIDWLINRPMPPARLLGT
ncbi:MAG: hypothetical protein ACREUT_13460 [Steroidobacteraceae bacterium]